MRGPDLELGALRLTKILFFPVGGEDTPMELLSAIARNGTAPIAKTIRSRNAQVIESPPGVLPTTASCLIGITTRAGRFDTGVFSFSLPPRQTASAALQRNISTYSNCMLVAEVN